MQLEIGAILAAIKNLQENSPASLIALTTLSAIINKISNQDTETRYASVDKNHHPGYAIDYFINKLKRNINSFCVRGQLSCKSNQVFLADIKQKIPLPNDAVDCIITSPPYANTMDYYLYHKQRMNILGFSFKTVLNAEIGSRHEFSSKRAPIEKWDADYLSAMAEMTRVMRSGANAFFVIGDSQVAGKLISGAETTEKAAKKLGLKYKLLESTPMSGRSRSFSSAFQRPNKFEHVIRLTKK
jgi:site-specific DNA-methyltransferase (cytosine-N4-specific)